MQTTAIRTVANSLPENEVILLTLLISKRYIPYTDLQKKFGIYDDLLENLKDMLDISTGGVASAYVMREEKDGVDVLHKYAEGNGRFSLFFF